ncbi:sugar porter family MFS transporter [Gluconacetobacter diazotrophicus]|uniref:Putative galactose-proton symporter n=1 Tax=Gluconacetobacter diazotrophicus (strain ATCC 49037 / DSM 5601 / CCUG 37298 / CIP 103539 / LMG 7603 / PAl5) TaxID=272568 RepID=A9H8X4_GLUDA|nr:sugar porter family MFS transporter [Gluconacetobacter diazotrophicus]CAP54586.1 putative galactose-proton symporter [Gluconacetobacter diazotrophicus PA1 5]
MSQVATISVQPLAPAGVAFLATLLAAAAGLPVGLDTGLIAEALGDIGQAFHASYRVQEWIVSVLMIGAAAGSLGAGAVSYRFGRRRTLLLAMLLVGAGAYLCLSASGVGQIIAGRLLIGVAVGTCAFTAPLYIAELATGDMRGRMVSIFSMLQSIGILAGYLVGGLCSAGGHWRWMVAFPLLPAALLFAAYFLLPESPAWLAARGRADAARRVLLRVRDDPARVDAELAAMAAERTRDRVGGFALLRRQPNFRRSVALGIGLQMFQQLGGINVVMYYAPRILEGAHADPAMAVWATVLVGGVNALVGLLAVFAVSRWGRRPLLVVSCALMAGAMLAAAAIVATDPPGAGVPVGLIAALLIFVAGFGLGAGPLVWTLCSEIQPLEGREFGVATSTLASWCGDWVVSNTFLSIVAVVGLPRAFIGYGVVNVLFILFTLRFVPETKGVPMEAIEAHLMAGEPLRRIGCPT